MTDRYCCVKECFNTRQTSKGLSFFRFPKDQKRCIQWLDNCGRRDLLHRSTNLHVSQYLICGNHFEDHFYAKPHFNRLRGSAVPTLFSKTVVGTKWPSHYKDDVLEYGNGAVEKEDESHVGNLLVKVEVDAFPTEGDMVDVHYNPLISIKTEPPDAQGSSALEQSLQQEPADVSEPKVELKTEIADTVCLTSEDGYIVPGHLTESFVSSDTRTATPLNVNSRKRLLKFLDARPEEVKWTPQLLEDLEISFREASSFQHKRMHKDKELNSGINIDEASDSDFVRSDDSEASEGNLSGSDDVTTTDRAPPRFSFSGLPGLQIDVPENSSPLYFFQLFFDEALLNIITTEINRLAQQTLQADLSPRSHSSKWIPTTNSEIMLVFALLMLQGVIRKPSIEDYWTKRAILATPIFSNVMAYKRFLLIFKFLHFTDSEREMACPDLKLWKHYTMIGNLREKFRTLYLPERDLSLDERLKDEKMYLKQYSQLGSARFGINFINLCEAKSGYICDFLIHAEETTIHSEKYSEYGQTTRTVLHLIDRFLGKGYSVTVNNSYVTPELCDFLVANKTDLHGEVKKNMCESDQELSHYRNQTISQNYCKQIFGNLLLMVIWNSFLLYNKSANEKISLLEYQLQLVEEVLDSCSAAVADSPKEARGNVFQPTRLRERHFPDLIPSNEVKKDPTRQCKVCSLKIDPTGKKVRKETRYYCEVCHVPLCVVPCFKIYHTPELLDFLYK